MNSLFLYIYAIIAGLSAVSLEALFRSTNQEFYKLLPVIIPVNVLLAFCVWKIMKGSSHLLMAAVVFSFGTYSMRLLASFFVLKESPSINMYIAFFVIFAAQFIRFIKF